MRRAAPAKPGLARARWLRSGILEVCAARRVVSDRRSLWRLFRLRVLPFTWRGRNAAAVPLRIRALTDREIWIRPRTADIHSVLDVFHFGHNESPKGLEREAPLVIYDLGANVGLTMVHLAELFPRASIVGVELQAENISQARRNLAHLRDRCRLVPAAIWPDDGVVSYHAERGDEQSARAAGRGELDTDVPALSISTLMRRQGHLRVDYVKMDIEGAEREVLSRNTDWASSVGSIRVEVHDPYTPEACMRDLRRLSFRVEAASDLRSAVVGER